MKVALSKNNYILDSIILILFVYSILGSVTGKISFILYPKLSLMTELSWKIALVISCLLVLRQAYFYRAKVIVRFEEALQQVGLKAALLFLVSIPLISNFIERKFIYYPGVNTLSAVLFFGLALSVILIIFNRLNQSTFQFNIRSLLIIQVIIASLFLSYANGRLIFSDDHPSFLYRLYLLMEHFPRIPFYNTEWNAGYSAREFYPSGVLNIFFISYPILAFFADFSSPEAASFYTKLIPYVYIFIVPFSLYFAAIAIGLNKQAATIAGIFALAPSLTYFEWLLKYGTLGYCFSASLFPLAFAYAYRVGFSDLTSVKDVIILLLVSSLCIMWSLSGFAFIPLAVVCIFTIFSGVTKRKIIFIVIFALLFLVFNLPWMLSFLLESRVSEFIQLDSLPGAQRAHTSADLSQVLFHAREQLVKLNPYLALLVFPGILFIKGNAMRVSLALTFLWLLLIAIFGEQIKPQLELRRMFLHFAFLAMLPVAALTSSLFESIFKQDNQGKLIIRFILVLLGSIAVISAPFLAATAYSNKSDEKFTFAPSNLSKLTQAMQTHAGNGRIFFLGFVLQELGAANYASQDGGHVGILPAFVNKPMYASDFYHRQWGVVDPIPRQYRMRGQEGIEEFLDLVNATSVVTFKPEWRDYCLARPDIYQQVVQMDRFRLFIRNSSNQTYFLEGTGELDINRDSLIVTPSSKTVILKFTFLERLRVSSETAVTLSPYFAFDKDAGKNSSARVDFIKLEVAEIGIPVRISF